MPLIKCPGCNIEISVRTSVCPICGCIIKKTNIDNKQEDKRYQENKRYDVFLNYVPNNRISFVTNYLCETLNISISEANGRIRSLPQKLFNNVSYENANRIWNTLNELNCNIQVFPHSGNEFYTDDDGVNNYYLAEMRKPKCPYCGSAMLRRISATSRVIHGAAFGLLSKTARSQMECLNCKMKF